VPNLNIPISEDLRRRIKSAAAARGESLKDFATRALEDAADKAEKDTARRRKTR
jgi:uncharacterized protein (DUF1778 family)